MSGTGVDRRLLVLAALVLVLAALVGYLAGHRPAGAAPREQILAASVGGVLLNAPSRWQPVPIAQQIPGFAIRRAIALGPGGSTADAGLLAGVLPAGQPRPLPSQLLARLRQRPTTEVVSLQEAQAYRYTGFSIAGFDKNLTVYVVPNPGGNSTVLACFAAPALSADLQACQRSVATLRLAGRSQSYDLTPQPEYAQRLSAVVSALDAQRVALRGQMGIGAAPRRLQRLAARMARAFARAAAAVSGLEPTLAIGQAQSALSGAILRARAAYVALAAAAGQRDEASFAAARAQVNEAEAGVDAALEGFALLGYKAV
jgi:hypothetical protein